MSAYGIALTGSGKAGFFKLEIKFSHPMQIITKVELNLCPQPSAGKLETAVTKAVKEFLGINVYYVNMDSLHVDKHRLPELHLAYLHKYNQELIGNQLGQFHYDFKLPCNHATIYSRYCMIVALKVYFDKLFCEVCSQMGEHYRAKGVPLFCVEAICRRFACSIKQIY